VTAAEADAVAAPAPAPAPAPDADAAPDGLMGKFRLTRYYVADEDDMKVVLASGRGGVTLYDDRGCKAIATVGRRFAEILDVQGTGRLRDGRVVNVSKTCRCGHSPCYRAMGDGAKWGMSATSRPLQPFRTVAVDPSVVKLGSVLYIAELDGLTMPGRAPWGGFVHDGCVVASDRGGGIDGKHLDFFVGRFEYKKALDTRRKLKSVTVHRGGARCGSGSARGGT
jgi:3D (Asp-Asp-Asp) domain-containing protein